MDQDHNRRLEAVEHRIDMISVDAPMPAHPNQEGAQRSVEPGKSPPGDHHIEPAGYMGSTRTSQLDLHEDDHIIDGPTLQAALSGLDYDGGIGFARGAPSPEPVTVELGNASTSRTAEQSFASKLDNTSVVSLNASESAANYGQDDEHNGNDHDVCMLFL